MAVVGNDARGRRAIVGSVVVVALLLLAVPIAIRLLRGDDTSSTVLAAGTWSAVDFRYGMSLSPPPDNPSPRLTADQAWRQFTGKPLSAPLYEGFRARLGILHEPESDTLVWAYTGPHCAIEVPNGPVDGPPPSPGPECRFWRFLDANTGLHVIEFQADSGDQ